MPPLLKLPLPVAFFMRKNADFDQKSTYFDGFESKSVKKTILLTEITFTFAPTNYLKQLS